MCINVLYVLVPVLVRVLLDGSGHDSTEIDGTVERHATSTPSKQPVPAPRHSSKLSTKTDLHLQFEDMQAMQTPKSPKTKIPEPSSKLAQKSPDTSKVSSKSTKRSPEKVRSPVKEEESPKLVKEPQSPKSKIPIKIKETNKDGEKTIVKEFTADDGRTTITEVVTTKFVESKLPAGTFQPQDSKVSPKTGLPSDGKTITEKYTTVKTTKSNTVDSTLTERDETAKMTTTIKSSSGESIDPQKFKEKFQDIADLKGTVSEQHEQLQGDGTVVRTFITRSTHSSDMVDPNDLEKFLKDDDAVKTVTIRTSSGEEIDPETLKDILKDGGLSRKTVTTVTRRIISSGEIDDGITTHDTPKTVSGFTTTSTGVVSPADFENLLKSGGSSKIVKTVQSTSGGPDEFYRSESGKEFSLKDFEDVTKNDALGKSVITETSDPEIYKKLLKDGKGVVRTVTTVQSSSGEPIDLQKLDFRDGKTTKTVTVKSSTGETIDPEKFKDFFKDGNVTSTKTIRETIRTVKSSSSEPETWTETVVTKRSADGKPQTWQTVVHSEDIRPEEWDTECSIDTSPGSGNGDFYAKNDNSRREMNSETDSDSSPQPRRRSPSKRRTLGSSSGSDVALHEGAELSPLEDDQGTSLTTNILSKQCTYPAN